MEMFGAVSSRVSGGRRLLDHDSAEMTAHYARLHDTTVRRHWEAARKVDITGKSVTIEQDGALSEAAWAKQRLGRATQALPLAVVIVHAPIANGRSGPRGISAPCQVKIGWDN